MIHGTILYCNTILCHGCIQIISPKEICIHKSFYKRSVFADLQAVLRKSDYAYIII